jgi:hypothetical protein
MRDGCDDVCTTNVVKEASFSFPIYNQSKPWKWVKVFNNIRFLLLKFRCPKGAFTLGVKDSSVESPNTTMLVI